MNQEIQHETKVVFNHEQLASINITESSADASLLQPDAAAGGCLDQVTTMRAHYHWLGFS